MELGGTQSSWILCNYGHGTQCRVLFDPFWCLLPTPESGGTLTCMVTKVKHSSGWELRVKRSMWRTYYLYLIVPRAPMTSIFEGQPLKTRSFPFKTRVIWVPDSFDVHLSIFIFVLSTTVCLSWLGNFQATGHVDCPPCCSFSFRML